MEQPNAPDADWFELKSERKSRIQKASWIPLYRDIDTDQGEFPAIGFTSECVATRTAIFPAGVPNLNEQITWNDLESSFGNRPEAAPSEYLPARLVWNHHARHDDEPVDGEMLVIENRTAGGIETLISPDLICALRLERVEDGWAYPPHGYDLVIHQKRRDDGSVHSVEIRAAYMKDYLCARFSQLVSATYRHRRAVLNSPPPFDHEDERRECGWFEFGCNAIDQDGGEHGVPLGVSIIRYAETDHDDDVPVQGVGDNAEMREFRGQIESTGPKRFYVQSEMTLVEALPPAGVSPIVRRDKVPANVGFVVDNDDTKMVASDLKKPPYGWLWFAPTLIPAVLSYPDTALTWLGRDRATLQLNRGKHVRFGVNQSNLINIFRKDVGELNTWWQERFVSHNVPPDGGVGAELMAEQRECRRIDTVAPESQLWSAVHRIDETFVDRFGHRLLVDHPATEDLWRGMHRFASKTDPEFYELAKNLYRLVVERFDLDWLKSQTTNSVVSSNAGSIKRVAAMLNDRGEDGRSATTVLVGLNELRQRGAHLPGERILANAYEMAGVSQSADPISKAVHLMANVAACLTTISEILNAPN